MENEKFNVINDTGYGLIHKSVMRAKELSIQAKAIYSYLSGFAGTSGKAFPSVKLIYSELGISKDTFYKYKKELELKGFVKIEKIKDSGKFMRNIYYLLPCPKSSDTTSSDTVSSDTTISDTINNSFKSNSFKSNSFNNNNTDTIVKKYNSLGLSQVNKITTERKNKINSRIKEYGLEFILETLDKVKQSDFLMGRSGDWKVNFDWLFKNNDNLIKVSEGNYNNNKKQPKYEVYRNKEKTEEEKEKSRISQEKTMAEMGYFPKEINGKMEWVKEGEKK